VTRPLIEPPQATLDARQHLGRSACYPSYAAHPLAALYAAGARVTINTDTPAIFGTTLTAEATLLATEFGLPEKAIQQVLRNAFEASFLSESERATIVD
jgi:adenosine deaminase